MDFFLKKYQAQIPLLLTPFLFCMFSLNFWCKQGKEYMQGSVALWLRKICNQAIVAYHLTTG